MKTKIVFAGVMGAILMSVGANAATTLATKGYVDQQVDAVNTTITNLGDTYATPDSVTNAINNAVNDLNLDTYEVLANKVNAISETMSEEEKTTKYPTVKAVLDAMPTLSEQDKQAIANLTGNNGLITRVGKVETAVETLNGAKNVEGSVAKQIADAIATHKTEADDAYQAKSTADLQIGTTGGVFRDMTDAEKAALASGITFGKVAGYDAAKTAVDELTGEGGAIKELQTVVGDENSGLVKDVAANKTAISKNADDIAKNAAAIATNKTDIAKRILTPTAECTGPESTCVLMIRSNNVVWTPVTEPVNDPVKPVEPAGSEG